MGPEVQELTFGENAQVFGMMYLIGAGLMFYISKRTGQPFIVPGDIYKLRAGRMVYLPTGGALIVGIILFILFKNFT